MVNKMTLDEFNKIVTETLPGVAFRFDRVDYTPDGYGLFAESWENQLTISWVTENFKFNHPFTIIGSGLAEIRQQKDLKDAIKLFIENSSENLTKSEIEFAKEIAKSRSFLLNLAKGV